MPYVSEAQRGWAHTPEGMKALGGAAKVAEWDAASKGMKLPKRVGPKSRSAMSQNKPRKPFGSFAP